MPKAFPDSDQNSILVFKEELKFRVPKARSVLKTPYYNL